MSLTPNTARAVLETAFIAAWSAAHPTEPFYLEGLSAPDMTTQTTSFVMFEVGMPKIVQSGLNGASPPKRYQGSVFVGLFVPEGAGTTTLFQMQATVENSLCVTTVSGIILRDMEVFKRTPAIGWQGRHLEIPYQFDSLP